MANTVCFKCTDRLTGDRDKDCHMTCPKYMQESAERQKRIEWVRQENELMAFTQRFERLMILREKKRKA